MGFFSFKYFPKKNFIVDFTVSADRLPRKPLHKIHPVSSGWPFSNIDPKFRLQTTMYYKVTRFAFVCLCVLCCIYVRFVLVRLSFFHRCEFLFVLFRILIMTCSFASASYYTRHTPMFITIPPNRKRKSTNLACNKLFVRYVVEINKPYTGYECVHVCFWIAF